MSAAASDSPYVFLSHNSLDKPQVIRLARALEARDVQVWLDAWRFQYDQEWEPALDAAIDGAAAVLACIGANGRGPWHDRELERARGQDRREMLVRLPGWSGGDLGLGSTQAFDLHADWNRAAESLAHDCAKLAPLRAPGAGRSGSYLGPFGNCPYPGIDLVFEPEHARWFHGRTEDTARILAAVQRQPWTWLVGRSGSGKSSLARAGVMAWWPTSQEVAGLAQVVGVDDEFSGRLAAALAQLGGPSIPIDAQVQVRKDPSAMRDLFLRVCQARPGRQFLLVIDQAERLFEPGGLRAHHARSFEALRDLALGDVGLRVLATIRSDCLAWVQRAAACRPLCGRGWLEDSLPSLESESLRDAIRLPARAVGADVERALIDRLAEETRAAEDGLPLLQMALQDLWARRSDSDGWLRYEDWPKEGALLDRLLEERLDQEGLRDLDPSTVDRLVTAFVDLDLRGEPVRKRCQRSAIPESVSETVERLDQARLVVTGGDETSGWIELAHDSVLRVWRELALGIERGREFLIWKRKLEQAREEHDAVPEGKQDSALLAGVALEIAKDWRGRRAADLDPRDIEFIDRSVRRELARARSARDGRGLPELLQPSLGLEDALAILAEGSWTGEDLLFLVRGWLERGDGSEDVVRAVLARVTPDAELEVAGRIHYALSEASLVDDARFFGAWARSIVRAEDVGIEMRSIPGGTHRIGSEEGDSSAYSDEVPAHDVLLDPFELARTPVTEEQMAAWLRQGSSHSRLPVVRTSWYAARLFCRAIGCELPTEVQREAACRAGSRSKYWFSDSERDLDRFGWTVMNSKGHLQPVGRKARRSWLGLKAAPQHPYGLLDMHGNVFEWCMDWYGSYELSARRGDGLRSAQGAGNRVLRGGSFTSTAGDARSASRLNAPPEVRIDYFGLRPARASQPANFTPSPPPAAEGWDISAP